MGINYETPHKGETDVWLTDPKLVESLGTFDFDPCACSLPRPWDLAPINWAIEDDGFAKDWDPVLRGWVNPPYGPQTTHWMKKCSSHGNCIALVYTRLATRWFNHCWKTATAFLFISHRLSFYRPDGTLAKGKPSANALIAWGDNNARALLNCGIEGVYVDQHRYLPGRRIN